MGGDWHHSAGLSAAAMMGKRRQKHGFRVRQSPMPRAIHLLPARQALFCPAQEHYSKAGHNREFLALPELRREHGYRSASRRQSIVSFAPAYWKLVAD